jgi:SAM-dependent methyltransferase
MAVVSAGRVHAAQRGRKMSKQKTWHEDDLFWDVISPRIFTEELWAAAPAEIDRILVMHGLKPGAAVLDLCCGPGRHSIALARRGFRVTGVDRTQAYLDRASRRARAEGLDIEFVQEDMRRFRRPRAFAGAINLFTSFGYFENQGDDRRVLANVFDSLEDGGVFVLDMMGKEVLAGMFRERDWLEQGGTLFLEERKVRRDWSWIENRWIVIQGKSRREFHWSHRLYSASELSDLLSQVGFGEVKIHGDLAGAPYDHTAKRLVAVARKPART